MSLGKRKSREPCGEEKGKEREAKKNCTAIGGGKHQRKKKKDNQEASHKVDIPRSANKEVQTECLGGEI